ncbi:NUDIX domain-containing protein [Sedimentitalea sp.]|uniref:NUDIX domain-containing protein n=1 Tax=Sedimentitalea sp. TaxID=2048915 RepID=UPI003298D59D
MIWREGKLLVQLKETPRKGRYLTLPGSKQEPSETLHRCVRRHCEEEDFRVDVGRLLHVEEVFKSRKDAVRHQLEHLFECAAPGAYETAMGRNPDKAQINPIWFDRTAATDRPQPAYDVALTGNNAPVYLGRFDG